MSAEAYAMAGEVQLSAERVYGILKMVAGYITNESQAHEDENLYYAIEAACHEVMSIHKIAEGYLDTSPSAAINLGEKD